MKNWSRCHDCGAVNDHDASVCYLCGSPHLISDCPGCGAGFVNPVETRCPVCRAPYRSELRETVAGPTERHADTGYCPDQTGERYLEG